MITGVTSGFGREIATQLLSRGDRVAGTVRDVEKVRDLLEAHPDTFHVELLDLTDTARIRPVVDAAAAWLGRLDVLVSNAGYGLFGGAEEATDAQIEHVLDTNVLGSIQTIRAALPHLREAGGGRIVQLSSSAGGSAHPGASLYHATKWAMEGFAQALAGEIAPFGIGVTIVEPGGARTSFLTGKQWGPALDVYEGTTVAAVRAMLTDPALQSPGDPVRMAAAMIATVDQTPAPLRLVLGSDSYRAISGALQARLDDTLRQKQSAASTDF